MSTGLLALLDDVVALAKKAAIILDDTAALSMKAGAKSVGVVADDAAVTPKYVIGFAASRELPIIFKITLGSLRNKFLFVLPAVLALGYFAPWAITPLLVLGALFLAFEGFEKVLEWITGAHHEEESPVLAEAPTPEEMAAFERKRVNSAIRTDLILSAEIMVIAYSELVDQPFLYQVVALAVVALGITLLVYGVVALIVKMDDMGLWLAMREEAPDFLRRVGCHVVKGMPAFLKGLSVVGTVAMLWVAGGILTHALAEYGFHGPERLGAMVPVIGPLTVSIVLGLLAGAVVWGLMLPVQRLRAGKRDEAAGH